MSKQRFLGGLLGANPLRDGSFTDVVPGNDPDYSSPLTPSTQSVSGLNTQMYGPKWNSDGTRLEYFDDFWDAYQYFTASTPYDITTLSQAAELSSQTTTTSGGGANWWTNAARTQFYYVRPNISSPTMIARHSFSTSTGVGSELSGVKQFSTSNQATNTYQIGTGNVVDSNTKLVVPQMQADQIQVHTITDVIGTGTLSAPAVFSVSNIEACAMHPDGEFIAVLLNDGTLKMFEMSTAFDITTCSQVYASSSGAYGDGMDVTTGTTWTPPGIFWGNDLLFVYDNDTQTMYEVDFGKLGTTVDRTTSNVGILSLDEAGPEANEGTAVAGDAHWSSVSLLLDNTNTTPTDLSTNQHSGISLASGTITAGSTNNSSVLHPYGSAPVPYLDFSNARVNLPSSVDLSGGDWTIECWASFDATTHYNSLFSSPSGGWQLHFNNNNQLEYSGSSSALTNTNVSISTNTWYFVSLSFVSSSNTLHLGVNGSVVSSSNSQWGTMTSNYMGGSGSTMRVASNRDGSRKHDGKMSDIRFTAGVARYTGNFTPPTEALPQNAAVAAKQLTQLNWGGIRGRDVLAGGTAASGDANWSDVVLLMDGEGTSIVDSSSIAANHTVTAYGPTTSTAQYKYGQSSLAMTNTYGNRITVSNDNGEFSFGTGDFTVEAWIYLTATPGSMGYPDAAWVVGGGQNNSATGFDLCISNSGIRFSIDDFGSPQISEATHGMSTSTWYHVAWVRNGTTLAVYVDGVAKGTATVASTLSADSMTNGIAIGAAEVSSVSLDGNFPGYIDDLRITKGVARYTGTFTPPQAAHPQSAGGAASTASIDYLVIGGGGGGGKGQSGSWVEWGGGGGAGGYLTSWNGGTALTYSSGATFTVSVGSGGAGSASIGVDGTSGDPSQFDTVTAAGGGGGGGGAASSGGSGGGASSAGNGSAHPTTYAGGAASPSGQGNAGASSVQARSGGGGGAGGAGSTSGTNNLGGDGGAGLTSTITGSSVVRAAGGGGSSYQQVPGSGGSGIGGDGERHQDHTSPNPQIAATDGAANTGSGGGGSSSYATNSTGGDGGSGVVILRVPDTVTLTQQSGGNLTFSQPQSVGSGEHYYEFTSGSGTLEVAISSSSSSLTNTGILSLSELLQASYGVAPSTVDIDYLVIAGGGGGGRYFGGGGGAGGYLTSWAAGGSETSGGGDTPGAALSYSDGATFTLSVGDGGTAVTSGSSTGAVGGDGGDSVFDTITATGGGGGGGRYYETGRSGGSGGGGGGLTGIAGSRTSSPVQGNNGGGGANRGSGGGGAGAVGGNAGNNQVGNGGAGRSSTITGTSVIRAGGGGGSGYQVGSGGSGGGGNGALDTQHGTSGTANTGSGGGGGANPSAGLPGVGGSGVVILRVPTSVTFTQITGNLTVPTPVAISGTSDHYYEFVGGGTSGTLRVNIS